jgi:chromosome segregation ATPase
VGLLDFIFDLFKPRPAMKDPELDEIKAVLDLYKNRIEYLEDFNYRNSAELSSTKKQLKDLQNRFKELSSSTNGTAL